MYKPRTISKNPNNFIGLINFHISISSYKTLLILVRAIFTNLLQNEFPTVNTRIIKMEIYKKIIIDDSDAYGILI